MQADLCLCGVHMSGGMLSHMVAQMPSTFEKYDVIVHVKHEKISIMITIKTTQSMFRNGKNAITKIL